MPSATIVKRVATSGGLSFVLAVAASYAVRAAASTRPVTITTESMLPEAWSQRKRSTALLLDISTSIRIHPTCFGVGSVMNAAIELKHLTDRPCDLNVASVQTTTSVLSFKTKTIGSCFTPTPDSCTMSADSGDDMPCPGGTAGCNGSAAFWGTS